MMSVIKHEEDLLSVRGLQYSNLQFDLGDPKCLWKGFG